MGEKIIQFSAFQNRKPRNQIPQRKDEGVVDIHPQINRDEKREDILDLLENAMKTMLDCMDDEAEKARMRRMLENAQDGRRNQVVGGISQTSYMQAREALGDYRLSQLEAMRDSNPKLKTTKPSLWKALNDLIREKSNF